jgi:hypothetical protein
MKKLVYTSMLLGAAILVVPSLMGAPRLQIPETEFDFGYAPQNSKVSHVFWLYNKGDDSLLIEKVVPG